MKRKQLPKEFRFYEDEVEKNLRIKTALDKKYPNLNYKNILDILMLINADLDMDCYKDIYAFKQFYKNRKNVLKTYQDFIKNTIEYIIPLYHTNFFSEEELEQYNIDMTYYRLPDILPEIGNIVKFIKKFMVTEKAKALAAESQEIYYKNFKYSDTLRVVNVLRSLIPYLKKYGITSAWEMAGVSCELINRVLPRESGFDQIRIHRIMESDKLIKKELARPKKKASKHK